MPAPLVVSNAMMACALGSIPANLKVLPDAAVTAGKQPAGVIADSLPLVNVPPFGMCSSLANPAVAAATAAAHGVLTPQACVPVVAAPWTPGSPTVLIGGQPALNQTCTCMCSYGGLISVSAPGQSTVMG